MGNLQGVTRLVLFYVLVDGKHMLSMLFSVPNLHGNEISLWIFDSREMTAENAEVVTNLYFRPYSTHEVEC